MIPEVTEATLRTISEQFQREDIDYSLDVLDKMEERQPELMKWVRGSAMEVAASSGVEDKDVLRLVQVNYMTTVLNLLQSLYAQQEVNELMETL